MNIVRIVVMLKRKFPEFYDIKHYKKFATEQLLIKKYYTNNQKITSTNKNE
ncbi:hypothetical protein HYX03_00145 [Candidatus Woesearchaeota archaeon]|nr:hypothetical protein [Candidatus Woesearchaeota archaeon]